MVDESLFQTLFDDTLIDLIEQNTKSKKVLNTISKIRGIHLPEGSETQGENETPTPPPDGAQGPAGSNIPKIQAISRSIQSLEKELENQRLFVDSAQHFQNTDESKLKIRDNITILTRIEDEFKKLVPEVKKIHGEVKQLVANNVQSQNTHIQYENVNYTDQEFTNIARIVDAWDTNLPHVIQETQSLKSVLEAILKNFEHGQGANNAEALEQQERERAERLKDMAETTAEENAALESSSNTNPESVEESAEANKAKAEEEEKAAKKAKEDARNLGFDAANELAEKNRQKAAEIAKNEDEVIKHIKELEERERARSEQDARRVEQIKNLREKLRETQRRQQTGQDSPTESEPKYEIIVHEADNLKNESRKAAKVAKKQDTPQGKLIEHQEEAIAIEAETISDEATAAKDNLENAQKNDSKKSRRRNQITRVQQKQYEIIKRASEILNHISTKLEEVQVDDSKLENAIRNILQQSQNNASINTLTSKDILAATVTNHEHILKLKDDKQKLEDYVSKIKSLKRKLYAKSRAYLRLIKDEPNVTQELADVLQQLQSKEEQFSQIDKTIIEKLNATIKSQLKLEQHCAKAAEEINKFKGVQRPKLEQDVQSLAAETKVNLEAVVISHQNYVILLRDATKLASDIVNDFFQLDRILNSDVESAEATTKVTIKGGATQAQPTQMPISPMPFNKGNDPKTIGSENHYDFRPEEQRGFNMSYPKNDPTRTSNSGGTGTANINLNR